jgi:DNA polymerase-3 subunit epsilon
VQKIKRQVILDTETTGLDPTKGHRLTEIGCLEMINRRLTGRKFHTYLNPQREIEKAAAAITGLTSAFLRDKPKFSEVAEDFVAFIKEGETELVIHNAPFDLGFLNHELMRIQHPWQPIEDYLGVIDTLVMARRLHPGQRNNLDVLCSRYKVDNTERQYHGALLDAQLLAKVYLAMTAGQTIMQLSAESAVTEAVQPKQNVQRVKRNVDKVLRVIRATEAELLLHEARMAFLEKASA